MLIRSRELHLVFWTTSKECRCDRSFANWFSCCRQVVGAHLLCVGDRSVTLFSAPWSRAPEGSKAVYTQVKFSVLEHLHCSFELQNLCLRAAKSNALFVSRFAPRFNARRRKPCSTLVVYPCALEVLFPNEDGTNTHENYIAHTRTKCPRR